MYEHESERFENSGPRLYLPWQCKTPHVPALGVCVRAKLWQDLHFRDDVFVTNDGVESRYNRIFGPSGVVAECVFKGSGDFIVHTMLQIKNVASHCACDIIKGDNIFGVAAAAYGAKANRVVRQYLDRPPVDFVKEGRQTDETLRFITTACVLMEICNDKKTTLLRDRDIIKKEMTFHNSL